MNKYFFLFCFLPLLGFSQVDSKSYKEDRINPLRNRTSTSKIINRSFGNFKPIRILANQSNDSLEKIIRLLSNMEIYDLNFSYDYSSTTPYNSIISSWTHDKEWEKACSEARTLRDTSLIKQLCHLLKKDLKDKFFSQEKLINNEVQLDNNKVSITNFNLSLCKYMSNINHPLAEESLKHFLIELNCKDVLDANQYHFLKTKYAVLNYLNEYSKRFSNDELARVKERINEEVIYYLKENPFNRSKDPYPQEDLNFGYFLVCYLQQKEGLNFLKQQVTKKTNFGDSGRFLLTLESELGQEIVFLHYLAQGDNPFNDYKLGKYLNKNKSISNLLQTYYKASDDNKKVKILELLGLINDPSLIDFYLREMEKEHTQIRVKALQALIKNNDLEVNQPIIDLVIKRREEHEFFPYFYAGKALSNKNNSAINHLSRVFETERLELQIWAIRHINWLNREKADELLISRFPNLTLEYVNENYIKMIEEGKSGTEIILIIALQRSENFGMGQMFLNSGNHHLSSEFWKKFPDARILGHSLRNSAELTIWGKK